MRPTYCFINFVFIISVFQIHMEVGILSLFFVSFFFYLGKKKIMQFLFIHNYKSCEKRHLKDVTCKKSIPFDVIQIHSSSFVHGFSIIIITENKRNSNSLSMPNQKKINSKNKLVTVSRVPSSLFYNLHIFKVRIFLVIDTEFFFPSNIPKMWHLLSNAH